MAIASYVDPVRGGIVGVVCDDGVAVRGLLARLRALDAGGKHPAAALERGDGTSLMLAPVEEGVVLLWQIEDGRSWHSVGNPAADGFVAFDYFGSFTEVPTTFVLPDPLALLAADTYLAGGESISPWLTLEAD